MSVIEGEDGREKGSDVVVDGESQWLKRTVADRKRHWDTGEGQTLIKTLIYTLEAAFASQRVKRRALGEKWSARETWSHWR